MAHSHENKNFHTHHGTSWQTNTIILPEEKTLAKLFKAVENSNENEVRYILEKEFKGYSNIMDLKNFCYDNNLFHIAAGINENKENKAPQAIMGLLLDKLKPTLMEETYALHLLFECWPSRCVLKPIVEKSCFWDINTMYDCLVTLRYKDGEHTVNRKLMNLDRRYTSLFLKKNSWDKTPLLVAAESGNIEIVKTLLKATVENFGNRFLSNNQDNNLEAIFSHMKNLAPTNSDIENLVGLLDPYIENFKKIDKQMSDACKSTTNGSLNNSITSSNDSYNSNEPYNSINDYNSSIASSRDSHNSREDPPQNSIKKPMQHNMQKRSIICSS